MKSEDSLSKNTVVTTVMSNMGLSMALRAIGIDTVRTDVGDKYVYEEMKREGYSLGGEESGHIIFSKYASTGDGLITSIKIMEAFIESKLPVSKLADGMTRYPQITLNTEVLDKESAVNDNDVQTALKETEALLCGEGRVLLRKSGTENVVRVMVEAKSEDVCKTAAEKIASVVRDKYGKKVVL